MKTNNSLFYLRQFVHLMAKGEEPRTAFNIMVNEVPAEQRDTWQQARTIFEATQSLERAFEKLNIKGSPITEQLRRGKALGLSELEVLQHYTEASSSEMQIAQIMKSRILRSTGYAALLSFIALAVLVVFSAYLIPAYNNIIFSEQMYSPNFQLRMDMLQFKSWWSLLLYVPPVLIIALFVLANLIRVESYTQSKFLSKLPIMRGIMMQLSRVRFIHNLNAFYERLPENKAERLKALNSPFFSQSEQLTFNHIFYAQEKEQLLALLKLQTFAEESPTLINTLETQAIESTHRKTGIMAIIMHLLVIAVVYQVVLSIYLPIFQMGSGF